MNITTKKYYPALVIIFCALFLLYKYVLQVSPSVITEELMRAFDVAGFGLGNLAATFFYSYVVTQVFVGPLVDRFGTRCLTASAILLCAIGAWLFANAHSLFQAEFGRILIGIGSSFATIAYLKMAMIWFPPERFAFVSGLLASAAMLGSMTGQAPFAFLVDAFDWRQATLILSIMGLVLSLLFYGVVRNKNPAFKIGTTLNEAPITLKDLISVLKCRENWCLMFYNGLVFSPIVILGGLWGNPFLQEAHHYSRTTAAGLNSMMFLGVALGAPLLGILSDRIQKRFAIMSISLVIELLSLTLFIYLPYDSPLLLGGLLFVFGFSAGAFMLCFSIAKDLNSIALAGTAIALINTGEALLGSFSEPLVGKLLDIFSHGRLENGVHYFSTQNYHDALLLLPIYVVLAGLFLSGLKKVQ